MDEMYVGGSPVQVGFELERHIRAGWEIDPQRPLQGGPYGTLECWLRRDPDITTEPKKTRAEILEAARAAKAAKREQKEETQ